MNARCYKTVFSKRLGALVAVGEHASGQGKATGASAAGQSAGSDALVGSFWGALSSIFALVALVWATPAWAQPAANALPTGGQVVQGVVQFSQSAQQLKINQSTDRAAVNWQSFDIGAAAKVNVVQPSAQSVLLNRVGGESPSQIFGQLQANGQVILVNPNGMVFGKDGSVSAAGFTGSTLNISDADFMAGKERYTRQGSAAAHSAIVNRGLIQTAPGGYVALLGASVTNEGQIIAPQGNVFMAAADAVTLPSPTVGLPIGQSGRIKLELTPASINAAVANHKGGTIVTEGGQVYLQAAALNQAMATVLQSGSIDTTGEQGGQVHVLADGGRIRVDGQIKANSSNGSAGGDIYIGRDKDSNVLAAVGDASGAILESKGGFVETSGQFLATHGTRVTAKDWLLDPTDITIAASSPSGDPYNSDFTAGTTSVILASDIVGSLNAGTNVTIATSSSNGTDAGNITVTSNISKTSGGAASLTLTAHNNIILNAGISSSTGTLGVTLNAGGAGGISGNASGAINTNGGMLTLNTTNALANGSLAGVISGTGAVTKTGIGTTTFTGQNSYSGGTHVQTGKLVGTNAGGDNHTYRGFGSGTITIANNAIAHANGVNGTGYNNLTNTVTGSGTFQITGSSVNRTIVSSNFSDFTGTIELLARNTQFTSGVNTTAGVNINAGATLSVWTVHGNPVIGALTGSGRVSPITSGDGFITIGNGDTGGEFSGVLTNTPTNAGGSASVHITKIGTGTQILTGANTYTGTTTISGGNLQIGNAGTTGTLGTGAVTNNAMLTFNRSNDITVSNVISGSGGLTQSGGGITTLTAANTFTGTTLVSGGSLALGHVNALQNSTLDTGTSGAQQVTFTAAGTNIYNIGALQGADNLAIGANSISVGSNNASTTYSGVLSGTGNFSKVGNGTQRLSGNNSYTGTTSISAGTLQIGIGGTTGTLGSGAVSVGSGSNLNFFRSNTLTVGNSMSGAGSINFQGTGVQDQSDYALSGNNTSFSGAISVSASRLRVSNPNQVGTAGITVNSGAGMIYSHNSLTLSNALSLAGNGWNEAAGYLGALRFQNGANFGGSITLTANARIGAHNDNGTVSGVISGAHNLEFNTPAGFSNSTVYLTNTGNYTGTTTVNVGTLQVGRGGPEGNLGATSSVSLVGGASLVFNKNTNTTIDKAIAGNGNVTANITGDLVMGSNVNLTGTNTINLSASGAITQTSGTLAATNLNMTSTSGAIGAAGQRVQTNVANLSVSAGGDVFVTEVNAVTVSGRTTANNGSFDIATSNGTMSIGSVNSIHGITANGTGNITLVGNATTGHGLSINNVITASNGNVNLTGTTASTTNPNAGVFSSHTVTAKNITMVASATAGSGAQLGYYGAGGNFDASQALSLTGRSNSSGNGLYSYTGRYASGTGMTLVGSSAAGQAMGFDAGVTVTNSTSGGISMTGTAADATRQAFGLRGVNMTNGGGSITMTATSGRIFSDAGNPVWGGGSQTNVITNNGSGPIQITAGNASASSSGSIDGSVLTISQNANANVVVITSGTGNITAPKIVNAGTGDIVVAAGTAIPAGTGTGGQVLTLAGNTLTQTNASPGKTYVFSGAPESTGVLRNLTSGFSNLYYQGTSLPLNAAFNTGFDANPADNMSVPGGGSASNTQVFFRTAVKPAFSLTLANNSKTYGDLDPTTWVATNGATLTNSVAGVGGSNTFAVSTANVLAGLSGGRATGEDVGSYAYELSAGNFNASLTAQPNLVIGKRDITLATLVASNRVYNGGAEATITSGTFGNLANGETLLISGSGLFDDKNAADGKTVTVSNVSTLTKANGTGKWTNYNLTTAAKTTIANISKATLTGTANNDARFVTQNDAFNFNGVSLSGFVGGDTPADVNMSGLAISRTHALSDTGAGHYVGVLVPTGLSSVNYNFSYVNGDYTIVPADRLLVRTSNQSLVYGTTPVFNTTAQYLDSRDNLIKTLTRTGTNNNFAFNDGAGTSISMLMRPYLGANVAAQSTSGQTVVGSFDIKDLAYTQTGSNFVGVPVFIGRLDITPKSITPSASGVRKVYDGTTAMSDVLVGMTGKFADDVVRISGTGAFAQKDAGSGLFYAVSNVVLNGADAENYYLANGTNSFSGTDGVITRASLVATANSLNTTFNGAAQSVSGFTVSGLVGGDSVNDLVGISASGATAINAGSYANTMTVADQTNYMVTGINGALVINPAPITITGISGALIGTVSKVYDGTNSAVLSPANYVLTGWLGSDGATVTKTAGTYNNANAGNAKPVSVSLSRADFLATGATDLSNYSLPTSVTGAVGVITRASLVATANSLNTTFNGAAQSVSGFTVSGLVGGDSVNDLVGISASGATATNAGSYANTMTVADQTNYSVMGVNGALVITPAPITVGNGTGGLTGTVSKVYDGTNTAVLSPANYVLTGWLGNDSATVTKTSGTYNNANAGDAKPVTVNLSRADFVGTGATDLSNYSLPTSVTGAVGVISPKEVSLSSFTVADKVYDGSTLATITSGSVLTGVGTETLSVRGTGNFLDKNVGDAKLVTPSDVSAFTQLDGSGSWLNYQLVNSNVTARASITPRPLQLSAQALDKRYDTTTGATITLGGLTGLVGAEQLQVMALGAFENAEVGTNKQVNVRFELRNGPNGGLGGNYSLAPQVLRASIIANPTATPPVQPSLAPVTVQPARSAVTFAGTAFAAVGEQVSVQPSVVSCDLSNVEDCACEPSKLDNVLICYVPREVTATGRMLPNNTGASVK